MKQILKTAVSVLAGMAVGGITVGGIIGKLSGEATAKAQKMSDKHLVLFRMMNQWVKVKQEGKNLSAYFEKNGYKKIAIYGMSFAGETLVDELKNTNTKVLYGIDQNADRLYAEVDIVNLDDHLGKVDAIVVTAITFFEEVEVKLNKLVDCPIISLEDVLYEV